MKRLIGHRRFVTWCINGGVGQDYKFTLGKLLAKLNAEVNHIDRCAVRGESKKLKKAITKPHSFALLITWARYAAPVAVPCFALLRIVEKLVQAKHYGNQFSVIKKEKRHRFSTTALKAEKVL